MTGTWQAAFALLALVVAVMGVMLVALARQLGSVLIQLSPGRPGELDGGPEVGSIVELADQSPGEPSVIVFVSPNCSLCDTLRPAFPIVAKHYPEVSLLAAAVSEDESRRVEYAAGYAEHGRSDMWGLYSSWNIPGTPYAVGIDAEGRIRVAGVVNSLDQLETVAEEVLRPVAIDPADSEPVNDQELVLTQ